MQPELTPYLCRLWNHNHVTFLLLCQQSQPLLRFLHALEIPRWKNRVHSSVYNVLLCEYMSLWRFVDNIASKGNTWKQCYSCELKWPKHILYRLIIDTIQTTISSQQNTHSTQGFWCCIPGQATNKKLSVDRVRACDTSNFFSNRRILGPTSCHNMQTSTHAQHQFTQHTCREQQHMAPFHLTMHKSVICNMD